MSKQNFPGQLVWSKDAIEIRGIRFRQNLSTFLAFDRIPLDGIDLGPKKKMKRNSPELNCNLWDDMESVVDQNVLSYFFDFFSFFSKLVSVDRAKMDRSLPASWLWHHRTVALDGHFGVFPTTSMVSDLKEFFKDMVIVKMKTRLKIALVVFYPIMRMRTVCLFDQTVPDWWKSYAIRSPA